MKKIIVGFSRSNKRIPLFSWLVRIYQWTSFSHTYIKIPFKHRFASDKILHASEGLVQNMSGTQFNKKHIVTDEFEIYLPDIMVKDKLTNTTRSLYHALLTVMHETAGDNYNYMQNIGIAYVDLMRRIFNKRVKNPWRKGWNCSEFVVSILKIVYPEDFSDLDPDTVTPKEIYEILKRLDKDGRYKIQKCQENVK